MKYLITVSLSLLLLLGLSLFHPGQSATTTVSSPGCPWSGDCPVNGDTAIKGCPHPEGNSDCPYQESATHGPGDRPYLKKNSERSGCPYLDQRSDDQRAVNVPGRVKNI